MELKDKIKRLEFFLKDKSSPVLVDFLKKENFQNYVVIDADISKEELYGNSSKPIWYQEILAKDCKYLIIENLNTIPVEEQLKFAPILKDRSFNNIEMPENTSIIVLIEPTEKEKINKEILSYLIII